MVCDYLYELLKKIKIIQSWHYFQLFKSQDVKIY
jgi:hypothetical protein